MKHYIELNSEQKLLEKYVNATIHSAVAKHFPKKCNNCKTVYADERAYTENTVRCGNSKHCDITEILIFMRNCKCNSTLLVPISYEDIDKTQLKAILDHAGTLGEIAKIQTLEKIAKNESIRTNGFWKYMRNLPQFRDQEEDSVHIQEITPNNWMELGLSILRDRYNMGLRGEHHRL